MMREHLPSTLKDLLALGDIEFVQAAYRTVLGREADGSGLATYVTMVRDGEDKARIIATLAASVEGRQIQSKLEGIASLREASIGDRPTWAKRLVRRLARAAGISDSESHLRLLRAVENRLIRIESNMAHQDVSLEALREQVLRSNSAVAATPGRAAELQPVDPALSEIPIEVPRQVPPRVEQLFRGLKQAAARRITDSGR